LNELFERCSRSARGPEAMPTSISVSLSVASTCHKLVLLVTTQQSVSRYGGGSLCSPISRDTLVTFSNEMWEDGLIATVRSQHLNGNYTDSWSCSMLEVSVLQPVLPYNLINAATLSRVFSKQGSCISPTA